MMKLRIISACVATAARISSSTDKLHTFFNTCFNDFEAKCSIEPASLSFLSNFVPNVKEISGFHLSVRSWIFS